MSKHQLFTEKTNMKVYFADPHPPWQRGTNENINGLIRQYCPKGTNFRNITREKIKLVQNQLNSRPRQSFGYETLFERFSQLLAEKGEVVPSGIGVALKG